MALRVRPGSRSHRPRIATVLAASAVLIVAVGSVQAGGNGGSGGGLMASSASDFDGDGFGDLAIGAPGDSINGRAGAGSVTILYGGTNGLKTAGSQLVSQNSINIEDASEAGDAFGTALAAGDFNRDGFADLAVGVPGEDRIVQNETRTDAGLVHVIFGSANGLSGAGDLFVGSSASGYRTGSAVATLDCRRDAPPPTDAAGDGHPELAIGSPGASSLSYTGSGKVAIFKWDAVAMNFDKITETDGSQSGSHLGASLASGSFDGTNPDDLAIGEPDYDLPGASDAGRVRIWRQPCANTGSPIYEMHMGLSSVPGEPAAGDKFGFALAAGPLDIPGGDRIFVGVPFDDLRGPIGEGPRVNAGTVFVCNATPAPGCTLWLEGAGGLPDQPESGDEFGYSITVGELGRGTGGDVAIGVPGEAVGGHEGAGAVVILYRNGTSQRWTENSSGIPNASGAGENMGRALASVNWGDGAPMDLAIGVPDQSFSSRADVGSVHVLYGSSNGLTAANDDFWHRAVAGVAGDEGANDRFGATLR